MGDKLSFGQTQNEVKFEFQVEFDLEVQDRSPPKITGILTKVFCTYVSNLVILAWTADELSCGQASDWYTHTDRHTDMGDDNTRRPELASVEIISLNNEADTKCLRPTDRQYRGQQ